MDVQCCEGCHEVDDRLYTTLIYHLLFESICNLIQIDYLSKKQSFLSCRGSSFDGSEQTSEGELDQINVRVRKLVPEWNQKYNLYLGFIHQILQNSRQPISVIDRIHEPDYGPKETKTAIESDHRKKKKPYHLISRFFKGCNYIR